MITHIDQGFDFLGHNVRKYNGKLLIKPAKKNVKAFTDNIRNLIKTAKATKASDLINILNPKVGQTTTATWSLKTSSAR